MKTKSFLIAVILFGMSVSNASAQHRKHSHHQKHRIKQGVKSGELKKNETKNLIEERKEIHQDVNLAKSDGKITPGERKIIRKEKRRQSYEIYRKKHNDRDRN